MASARSWRSIARQSSSESLPVRRSSSASRISRYLASLARLELVALAPPARLARAGRRARSGPADEPHDGAEHGEDDQRSQDVHGAARARRAELLRHARGVAGAHARAGASRRRPQRDQAAGEDDERRRSRSTRRAARRRPGRSRAAARGVALRRAGERLGEAAAPLLDVGELAPASEHLVGLLDRPARARDVRLHAVQRSRRRPGAAADLARRLALEERATGAERRGPSTGSSRARGAASRPACRPGGPAGRRRARSARPRPPLVVALAVGRS